MYTNTTNIYAYMCVAIYLLLTDCICEIKIQFGISACLRRCFIIVCLHMFDCLSQQAILDYTQKVDFPSLALKSVPSGV